MQITKKTNKKKAIGTESYKSFRNMQHSLFTASPRFSGPPVTFSTLLFQCSLYHWPLHLLLHLSFRPSQRSHSFSFSSQLPSCLALFKPCWDNIENYLVLKNSARFTSSTQTHMQTIAFIVHFSHPMKRDRERWRRRLGGNVKWSRGKTNQRMLSFSRTTATGLICVNPSSVSTESAL